MENQNNRSTQITNIVLAILIAFAIIFGSMYLYAEHEKKKRIEEAQEMLNNFISN